MAAGLLPVTYHHSCIIEDYVRMRTVSAQLVLFTCRARVLSPEQIMSL